MDCIKRWHHTMMIGHIDSFIFPHHAIMCGETVKLTLLVCCFACGDLPLDRHRLVLCPYNLSSGRASTCRVLLHLHFGYCKWQADGALNMHSTLSGKRKGISACLYIALNQLRASKVSTCKCIQCRANSCFNNWHRNSPILKSILDHLCDCHWLCGVIRMKQILSCMGTFLQWRYSCIPENR